MQKNLQTEGEEHALLRSKIFLTHSVKLINAPLNLNERLNLIVRIIADYLSVDDVAIFLKEPSSGTPDDEKEHVNREFQ